jgi:hypothetical protein
VAKEIWLCDKRTVTKYLGEIDDFKMQLRRQLESDNLIEGGGKPQQVMQVGKLFTPLCPWKTGGISPPGSVALVVDGFATEIDRSFLIPSLWGWLSNSLFCAVHCPQVASMTSKRLLADSNVPEMTVAPPLPPTKETEEQAIMRARMELADLAIARQRARKADTTGTTATSATVTAAASSAGTSTAVSASPSEEDLEAKAKAEEKAAAKAKRKAEKEAQEALAKREEEERVLRREEKLREAEDAKRLKEQKAKEHEEFLAQKAVRDAKKKAAEDAEAAALAEAAAARKAEREARKREKLAQKAAAQEAARLAAEQAVLADVWSQDQQLRFESALLEHTALTDKYDRWSAIARAVGDKTMNQCIMRYRYLKEYVLKRKEIEASAIA